MTTQVHNRWHANPAKRMKAFRHILFSALVVGTAAFLRVSAAGPDPAAVDAAFQKLPKVQYGYKEEELQPIEQAVAAAHQDAALRTRLEERLLAVLQSDSTEAAKDFACRQLRLVGSEKAVGPLAALLPDPHLSGLARFALEPLPYPAVDAALREAAQKTTGRQQVGVIHSLGIRRDRHAVPLLSRFAQQGESATAQAAITALGKIATPEAARLLMRLHAGARGAHRLHLAQACLEAAQKLLQDGNARLAGDVCEVMLQRHAWGHIHEGAFRGLVQARPAQAESLLLGALKGADPRMQKLAGALIADWSGPRIPPRLLRAMPELPAGSQIALADAIRLRRETAARAAVLPLIKSDVADVRAAAWAALGVVGQAADVPVLAAAAALSTGAEQEAARKSLTELSGHGVVQALIKHLKGAKPPVQVALLQSFAERRDPALADATASVLTSPHNEVRQAAAEALRVLGHEKHVAALVTALERASNTEERETLTRALEAVCARAGRPAAKPLLAALPTASPATRVTLLRTLGLAGGPEALKAVRDALKASEPEVRDAALRALSEWPELDAAPDLLSVIRTTDNPAHRALAFRGYVRLARVAHAPVAQRLAMLQEAMTLARNDADKKQVASALGDLASVEALQFAAKLLDDPDVVNEAAAAALRIAPQLPEQDKPTIAKVLDQVAAKATADPIRQEARRVRRRLQL